MATLAFRNSYGELIDIPTVAATRVKNEFAAILDQASSGGAVAITRHDTPKAVLISYAEFESLIKLRTLALDDLSTEFDGMLARMQAQGWAAPRSRVSTNKPALLLTLARLLVTG